MVGNSSHLDGSYAKAFGKVTDGIEIILNIANEEVFGDTPKNKTNYK